jgi:hypothetical protein
MDLLSQNRLEYLSLQKMMTEKNLSNTSFGSWVANKYCWNDESLINETDFEMAYSIIIKKYVKNF